MMWQDDILYEYVLTVYLLDSLYENVKEPIRIGYLRERDNFMELGLAFPLFDRRLRMISLIVQI